MTFDTFADTWECHELLRLSRKTTLQLALKPWNRIGSAPIDTARPQENQRLETRHAGASKWAFRARLPPIFTLWSFRIDVFLRAFLWTWKFDRCFVRGFRQFSAHLTKCHACHGICTLSPLEAALTMRFAKNTQHDSSKVLRLPRKWRRSRPKCCACHENWNSSSENVAIVLRLPRKTTFDTLRNTSECHEVPRLATPKEWPPLPIYSDLARTVADGCERLRTVADGCADGCGRLRTVAQRRANTPSTPRPPEWNGNPCYAFGKINITKLNCPNCDPGFVSQTFLQVRFELSSLRSSSHFLCCTTGFCGLNLGNKLSVGWKTWAWSRYVII